VADADDPVGPRKLVLIVVGLFLGLVCGIAVALILTARALVARQGE
jgi:uncharacterized protein involved in exopolysaccharide biosynthesis